MRLRATEAIHRGLLNVRANWELSVVLWVQTLVQAVVFGLGLIPVLLVLGLDMSMVLDPTGAAWPTPDADSLPQILGNLTARIGPMIGAVLVTMLAWSFSFVVYSFFQGGVLAILIAADRQCVRGFPPDWSLFRTFSMRNLVGWGRKYVWRFFWLFNLFFVFFLVWVLLSLCLVLLVVFAYQRWGGAAAVGFGCGGVLPLLIGMLVVGISLSLAQADLAREEGSIWAATRRGLAVLGARTGAVALIILLTILAGLTMGLGFALFPVILMPFTGGAAAVQITIQFAGMMLQWLFGAAISLVSMASLVALVQDHRAATS